MEGQTLIKVGNDKAVGVIGTGDFGRAVGARLAQAGYSVIFGSRNPAGRRGFLPQVNPSLRGVPVLNIPDCLSKVKIVVLAIQAEDHQGLLVYKELLEGKIIVDVSNPTKSSSKKSQAETLQELLPESRVVKAFNTLSAYTLLAEQVAGGSQTVYICGQDPEARILVQVMAVTMGMQAVDTGGLSQARALETSMQTLFAHWGGALIVTFLWFIFWTIYSYCRYYVLRETNPYTPERFPTNVFNKVFSCMAITLLAFCYLPGCIVAIIQLVRGTKYKALPGWLVGWMAMRKQLGLYGLFFCLLHAFMSACLLTPAYYSKWFHTSKVTVPGNMTQDMSFTLGSRMTWMGETTILMATLSTALFCILGITSLPSVTSRLNWREWNFVQTYLGLACLLLACAHVTIKAAPDWVKMTFVDILQGLSFLSQFIPYIVLALRLILWLPCIYTRLQKIRRGHVYGNGDGSKVNIQVEDVEARGSGAYANGGFVKTDNTSL